MARIGRMAGGAMAEASLGGSTSTGSNGEASYTNSPYVRRMAASLATISSNVAGRVCSSISFVGQKMDTATS